MKIILSLVLTMFFNTTAKADFISLGSGGVLNANKISANSNNSTLVKATTGTVWSITACNINAAVRYVKLYNKATAPTCGTDTPVVRVVVPVNNCVTIPFPVGIAFATGIGYCIVTGIADSDNTSTAANEQTLNISYN